VLLDLIPVCSEYWLVTLEIPRYMVSPLASVVGSVLVTVFVMPIMCVEPTLGQSSLSLHGTMTLNG